MHPSSRRRLDCLEPLGGTCLSEEDFRPSVLLAAQKAHALLEAADILTEKPSLSEADVVSLDVLLAEAREYIWAILQWSEQHECTEGGVETSQQ